MADVIANPHRVPRQDFSGSRFGRWTVVGLSEIGEKARLDKWLCRCDCGAEKLIALRNLTSGDSKSCGCLRAELTGQRFSKSPRKRGYSSSHPFEYASYSGMIARCHNPEHKDYKYYGAVGRRVCDRWRHGEGDKTGFECFIDDMGFRTEGLSIDRIDNDKGYFPGNCRWATMKQQNRNRGNKIRK